MAVIYDVIHHQSANNMRFPFLKNNMTVPSYINGFQVKFPPIVLKKGGGTKEGKKKKSKCSSRAMEDKIRPSTQCESKDSMVEEEDLKMLKELVNLKPQ
ncbi:hypothetical protein QQP08_004535 [Theobroma cacao]|nr:hypothetical protein QQP08_004535 [Theobroma cacao]